MLYRGRNKKEFYLASLLYDSIEFRHIKSVKTLLVEKKADPNLILIKKGIAPFHLVVGCESEEFALEITALILQNGGNPNVRSEEGLTPVHIAAAWGKLELLRLLLANGGDAEARDINRKTPSEYAAAQGHTECLNLLKVHAEPGLADFADTNSMILEKIVINNGSVIGEYKRTGELGPAETETHLDTLPGSNATEFILKWFDQQQSVAGNVLNDAPTSYSDSTTGLEHPDSSPGESDGDRTSKRYDTRYITFRKVYRKTRSQKKSNSVLKTPEVPVAVVESAVVDEDTTNCTEYSKESGIVTLGASFDVSTKVESPGMRHERSSDYLTCSQTSINALDRNVFELTEDLSCSQKNNSGSSRDLSFVSVSEVYKYIDNAEGIVLYEKRLLKSPSECADSVKSLNISRPSTLPDALNYDTDSLRKELTLLGFSVGPITATTKRVYLKKLYQLKTTLPPLTPAPVKLTKRVYSVELEKTLRQVDWLSDLSAYKTLESELGRQFSNPDPSRKWREGVSKSSFTYLLLDPRITNNLPSRAETLSSQQLWETFLSAIFYVGKGKRSRPYQHLYDAVQLWKSQKSPANKKLKRITDIWSDGGGVICLHVFLNTIPVEAYTREAAIISALTLDSLTNLKGGEFHGISATWTNKQKKMLGVFLLYKSMMIFLNEGERQLCPDDIG